MGKFWPKVNLPEVVTHLAMRCLSWGGGGALGWGVMGVRGQGVHLTKGQPAQSSTPLGHEMCLLGLGSREQGVLGGGGMLGGRVYIWLACPE